MLERDCPGGHCCGWSPTQPRSVDLMKVIGRGCDAGVVIEAFDAAGFHMDHVVDVLQFAFDDQKGFLGEHEALQFE